MGVRCYIKSQSAVKVHHIRGKIEIRVIMGTSQLTVSLFGDIERVGVMANVFFKDKRRFATDRVNYEGGGLAIYTFDGYIP